jgi:5-methyltetrahydrofolate--homocysteine methyltransferase
MGVIPETAAEKLHEAGADIFGANCGAGIDQMIEIVPLMKKVSERALWFKANAGLPELIDGKTVFRETPEYMASRVPDLLAAGAGIIGGCCGTTPDHIRAVRKVIDSSIA